MSDPALLPATTLQRMLQRGEIRPVEVAEACLRRVEAFNRALSAIVTVNERLLDDALALERSGNRGLLYGLPVGIKDSTDTAGLRTTYGSPLYRNHVPRQNALVVERLLAQGALLVGKTNVPEFAVGGTTSNAVFGPTRNPWDVRLTPGGSTGGGAAALAAGMIALSDGTDLGGSLRMPASYCGVVGLRPSPGLVPTVPSVHAWDRLSVTGGMGRTAGDVALFLRAARGPSPDSPVSAAPVGRAPDAPRLAYCGDVARIGIAAETERICRAAAFALGARELDVDLSAGRQAFAALRRYHLLAQHADRLDRLADLGPNLAANLRSALRQSPCALAAAERVRTRIWRTFREFFRTSDYLFTPCMAVQPFPVELEFPREVAGRAMDTYYDWFAPTSVLSLTGLPVGCVPCGLDAAGLPVGIQIVGRTEAGVLDVAARMQRAFPIGLPAL